MDLTIHPHPLAGATCAIASKSLAHRALILAAAILSLFVNAWSLGTKDASPFGFASLALGYELSCYATSYAAAAAGGILLFGGTAVYLKSLHRKYLWQ